MYKSRNGKETWKSENIQQKFHPVSERLKTWDDMNALYTYTLEIKALDNPRCQQRERDMQAHVRQNYIIFS